MMLNNINASFDPPSFKIHTHAPFTSPTSAAKREQSNAGEVKVSQDFILSTRPCPTTSPWFDFSAFAILFLTLGCLLSSYTDAADSAEEGEDGDDGENGEDGDDGDDGEDGEDGEENYLNYDEDLTMMITTCT